MASEFDKRFRRKVAKHETRRLWEQFLDMKDAPDAGNLKNPDLVLYGKDLESYREAADKSAAAAGEARPPGSSFKLKEYVQEVARAESAAKLGDLAGESPPAIKTGGFLDTRNDVNADGKYLLLAVPEFKKDMTTYLRLGAACSTWESALGNELEKMVHLAGPAGKATELPFINDERKRNGHPVHSGIGATLSESAILHTKGGWRDHTDGNRITTTYGDKIEVIRGNYKMVILGRQESPVDSAGWDTSGQHIQDWAYTMPGASVTLEFIPEYENGVWLLKNSTENVAQWSRFAGSFKEEWWGHMKESYIGQEQPQEMAVPEQGWAPGVELSPVPRGNPVIIEKKFATSITSQTGSTACPVPAIDESTYVTASTSLKTADTISETTTVTGAITSATTAGSTSATTSVSGSIESSTTAESIAESTTVGAATSNMVAGAITEQTVAGAIVGTTVAGVVTDTTVGNTVSALVGTDWSLAVGNAASLLLGAEESIKLGVLMLDIAIAAKIISISTSKLTITMGDDNNMVLGQSRSFTLADIVQMSPTDIRLTAYASRVAGFFGFV